MKLFENKNLWALILGGSSGMGLASAKKLASAGMNLVIIHRDRRSELERIEREFEWIKSQDVTLVSYNEDALGEEKRGKLIEEIKDHIGSGKIRLLLHSIAKGNLKPIAKNTEVNIPSAESEVESKIEEYHKLLSDIQYPNAVLNELDFSLTLQAMATSMVSWVQSISDENLFDNGAQVIGLTSEGDQRIWKGYGAVAAAKAALDAIAKHLAVELAPKGINTNIIQAGITKTPSQAMIPGGDLMSASAKYRNPKGRLTTPEDVANVVYLLAQDESRWINGSRIIVDGGEHLV